MRCHTFKFKKLLYNLLLIASISFLVFKLSQLLIWDNFNIPTESMMPTIKPKDHVIVEKLTMGARLFNPSNLNDADKKSFRLHGLGHLERYDLIVFNRPYKNNIDSVAIDFSTYQLKRCCGLPGDTIEVIDGQLSVNGTPSDIKGNLNDLENSFIPQSSFVYRQNWNLSNWGPHYVPKKGYYIDSNSLKNIFYHNIIQWETGKHLKIVDDSILLGDSAISEYEFKYNYYFTLGDNMANSRDSRFWGFVPETFIVGRVSYIFNFTDFKFIHL